MCAFAYGYFPVSGQISLEAPDLIEMARNATINRRQTWARYGFALFVGGVLMTVGATAYFFVS